MAVTCFSIDVPGSLSITMSVFVVLRRGYRIQPSTEDLSRWPGYRAPSDRDEPRSAARLVHRPRCIRVLSREGTGVCQEMGRSLRRGHEALEHGTGEPTCCRWLQAPFDRLARDFLSCRALLGVHLRRAKGWQFSFLQSRQQCASDGRLARSANPVIQ